MTAINMHFFTPCLRCYQLKYDQELEGIGMPNNTLPARPFWNLPVTGLLA